MRLPRFRLRTLLVAIAATALALGVVAESFRERASICIGKSEFYQALAMQSQNIADGGGLTAWAYSNQTRKARAYDRLSRRFREAAVRPWRRPPDDPGSRGWKLIP